MISHIRQLGLEADDAQKALVLRRFTKYAEAPTAAAKVAKVTAPAEKAVTVLESSADVDLATQLAALWEETGGSMGRAAAGHDAKVVINDGVAMTPIISDQLNSDMSDAGTTVDSGASTHCTNGTTALENYLRSSATSLRSVPSFVASTIYADCYTFWFVVFLVLSFALGGALVMQPANATNVGAFHPSTNMVPSATVDPQYHEVLAVVRLTDARPPPLTVSFGYLQHFLMMAIAILLYQPAWFWYITLHFPFDVARAVTYRLVAPLAVIPSAYPKHAL